MSHDHVIIIKNIESSRIIIIYSTYINFKNNI